MDPLGLYTTNFPLLDTLVTEATASTLPNDLVKFSPVKMIAIEKLLLTCWIRGKASMPAWRGNCFLEIYFNSYAKIKKERCFSNQLKTL
jgi:hypothetical protein